MEKTIIGEVWRPDPPPPGCDCVVCEAKRQRLAEVMESKKEPESFDEDGGCTGGGIGEDDAPVG